MLFKQTPIDGVLIIDLEKRGDDRGWFARTFCEKEFAEHGLQTHFAQTMVSVNAKRGTLRGMHYQLAPHAELKLVRCASGAFWDVVLDLRPGSSTFGQWFGIELTAESRTALYIPRGFAHGFITLADNTEATYMTHGVYTPALERGVRWNDPRFAIDWPIQPEVMADRDRNFPDFDPAWHLGDQAAEGADQ